MDNNTKAQHLLDLVKELPDCCNSFLLETGMTRSIATRITYAHNLKWFFEYLITYYPDFCDYKIKDFKTDDLKKITSMDINRYLTIASINKGEKEKTTNLRKVAISSLYKYLIRNNILKENENPVINSETVKIHKKDYIIYLNTDEQNILLNGIDSGNKLSDRAKKFHDDYRLRDYTLIMLFLNTGMRISEVNGINIGDVDLNNNCVYITRKGGKFAQIYYSDEVTDLLREYINSRKITDVNFNDKAPLFVTKQNNRLSIRAIQVLVKKYVSANLPGKSEQIHVHSLRSSYAMSYLRATNELSTLSKSLGHSDISTTSIYAGALKEDIKRNRNWNNKKEN